MFEFFKGNKSYTLLSPISGKLTDITTLPDPVFAEKMLGDGFAVNPSENTVRSPISGTIIEIHDSLHAYGIESSNGLQILVHIGINTVELNNAGFKPMVKKGDKIKAGDPLADVNFGLIKSKGYSPFVIVIITNQDKIKSMSVISSQNVIGGKTEILTYKI